MKESKAWDGGQQPGKKLGFKHRSAEGAGDTTGRARFEDSASEEGTTGRTRVRTSCPVQELREMSLESGYSTNTLLFSSVCGLKVFSYVVCSAKERSSAMLQ